MGTSVEDSAPSIIVYTSIAFAVLASFGCIFVGVSYVAHPRLRTFTFRMILFMAIFDAIVFCAAITGPAGNISMQAGNEALSWSCKAQAFCVQFGISASLIWTLCFAGHLMRITSVHAKAYNVHSIYTFLLYLLVTIVPSGYSAYYLFLNDLIGVTGSDEWCWIDEDYIEEYEWKILYLPVAIIIIIDVVLYCLMRVRIRILTNQELESSLLKQSRRRFVRTIAGGLSAYLGAPFVAWVPAHFNWVCTKYGMFDCQCLFVLRLFVA